jgi:hypothetical protein
LQRKRLLQGPDAKIAFLHDEGDEKALEPKDFPEAQCGGGRTSVFIGVVAGAALALRRFGAGGVFPRLLLFCDFGLFFSGFGRPAAAAFLFFFHAAL